MNVLAWIHIAVKTFAYAAMAAIALLAVGFTAILVRSPGKPKPFTDESGRVLERSISEKGSVRIRGAALGYFIKGRDVNAPILLYLHGGMPDYFLTERYPSGLDELFTVVWLDQRGAGRSYDPAESGSASMSDMVADVLAFTEYLRERFSREQLYLMGHSGGSYLGIKVIEAKPDAYAAYIGVAQIANQKLSEKLSYDYILAAYAGRPDRKRIYDALLSEPLTLDAPLPASYLRYRDFAMHELGVGTTRDMKNVVTGMFLPSLYFSEYTIAEKIRLWRAKASSGISAIWTEVIGHDLSRESLSLKLPVYFLHGVHDYTCSFGLAKEYYDRIDAPAKGFFALSDSAHSPIFEQPQECLAIIREHILP
jgi:pimeloyl-ACP methyl ester carboxylesterase